LNISLSFKIDPDFQERRLYGGGERIEFSETKTPRLGLGRILIQGLKAQAAPQEKIAAGLVT
jgi:hypothetical protein